MSVCVFVRKSVSASACVCVFGRKCVSASACVSVCLFVREMCANASVSPPALAWPATASWSPFSRAEITEEL